MSVSIYYRASRDHALSSEEDAAVKASAERASAGYPFGEIYEDLCFYSAPFDMKDTVLQGSTALPAGDENVYEILLYWLECLTEIRRVLPGCEWEMSLEDTELEWDEAGGWQLPEYMDH